MKKKINRKSIILLSVGSFTIAVSQLISQLTDFPDVAKGLLFGLGIGLLVLAIILNNFKPVH